jgi:hypothetical protein
MKKLSLVVEKSRDGKLWGRVELNDDLIVESAISLDALQRKMKKLLQKFHHIDAATIEFQLVHDLTALFLQKNYLNVSAIGVKAKINPGLMRQYVAGFKHPSPERAKAIEKVVNDLGQELIGIKIAVVKSRNVVKPKPAKGKIAVKKKGPLITA